MHKPSREAEVLEIIENHGPITSQDIAFRLGMSKASVSFYAAKLKNSIRVGDWDETRSICGKRIYSRMWVVGTEKDAPLVKGKKAVLRAIPDFDIAQMPFRSVFVGGVSPWAVMEQAA